MAFSLCLLTVSAQTDKVETDADKTVSDKVFNGSFFNKDYSINMKLNLYESNIPIPGLELDSCYGYLQGALNGTWVVLKVKSIEGDVAVVRAASDRGSDAQDVEFTITDNGVDMRQLDGASIKTVAKGKYVKLPKVVSFEK